MESDKKVEFSVEGLMMTEGETYTLVVNETGTTTEKRIKVTFSSKTEGSGSATLYPLSGADLGYSTDYTLTGVTDSKSKSIHFVSGLSFKTKAEPSCLVTFTLEGYDVGVKRVGFSMTGRELSEGSKYSVGVSASGEEKHKVLMSLNGSSKRWEGSASLFPLSGAEMDFGKTYNVSSFLEVGNSSSLFFENQSVTIESEPARLVSTSLDKSGGPNSTTLKLTSRQLTLNAKYEIALSFSPTSSLPSNSDSTTTLNVTVTSETDNSFSLTLYPESTADLVYGQTYVVTSMKTGSTAPILIEESSCSFVTPPEPARLASIGVGEMISNEDESTITLSFYSFSLQPSTSYTFEFASSASTDQPSHTKTLVLTTKADGSFSPRVMTLFPRATTEAEQNAQFEFDRTYSLTSFENSSSDILIDTPISLAIPSEPTRLTSLWIGRYSESDKKVEFSVEGLMMTEGETYTLIVNETGTNTEKRIKATFSSKTEGSGSATLFPLSGANLDYNTDYTLTGVTDSQTKEILFISGLSFQTKPEPERLLSISPDTLVADSKTSSVSLSFTSSALLGKTEYTLALKSLPTSDETPHFKTLKVTTDEHGNIADMLAVLYPLEDEEQKKWQLEFDTTYMLSSLTRQSTPIFFESSSTTFHTTRESPRIEKMISAILSKDRSEVEMIFSGRALVGSLGPLVLSDDSTTWESSSDLLCSSSTQCSAAFKTVLGQSQDHLEFGGVYEVLSSDISKYVVNSGVSARVPFAPQFSSTSFKFWNSLNTSCVVVFGGSDLVEGTSYSVGLANSLSFVITVVNSSAAVSSPLAIGWEDSLQFSTPYQIVSITPLDEEDGDLVFKGLSFETEAKPSQISLSIDSCGSESKICGTANDPCCSIEIGWWIVRGIGFSSSTFSIVHNSTLKERIRIPSNHDIVLRAGPSSKPELLVSPSTPSSGVLSVEDERQEMIEVSKSRVWMNQVDVVLTDSCSVVFIRIVDGRLTLESCSITGDSSSSPEITNSGDFECSWSLGAFLLVNTTTSVTSSTFSGLSLGAINIEGGNLTIETSVFHDNSPNHSSFPSARRNIHCSDEGQVTIGSLHGGDGTVDHPSAWISAIDCEVGGADAKQASPHFIPTLSSKSTSSFNKKNKTFTLEMTGTTLIPCGLFLEVFEVTKEKTEGNTEEAKLDLDTTTSFTETSISITLSQSSLSSLDPSLEWRGRLIFGENERSTESFVVQASSVERLSQSVKDNMKWWLPVAIVLGISFILLIVIVLLCCQRKKNGKKDSLASQKELDCVDEMKIEMKEEFGCGIDVHVMGNESTYTGLKAVDEKSETARCDTSHESATNIFGVEMIAAIRFNEQNEKVEEVLGNKMDTLFNRLHNPLHKPLRNRRRVSWEIGRGLMKIASKDKNAMILGFLSPHLIMFDKNDGILFQQNAPSHGPLEPSSVVPPTASIDAPVLPQLLSDGMEKEKGEHVLMNEMDKELLSFDASLQSQTNNAEQSFVVSEETQPNSRLSSFGGIRWMAPELVNRDGTMRTEGVDLTKAAVFSLGLVLFSIETGQVPFGEIDALSAHRQLSSGLLPLMELVSSEEMAEMITECVSPVAKNRPSLSEFESFLAQQASKNPTPFHYSPSSFDHPSKEWCVLHNVSPGIFNSQVNPLLSFHSNNTLSFFLILIRPSIIGTNGVLSNVCR
ncbi:hypothetical protein BLNAU_22478 [Blattamonas nauphoetae]|uniref:Protein kinase domain-containing protein n=1 Tax=Blattamonas nauphoetae TaxID=2049346 RepID=A0ABQ9WTF1_9EUKA|nr:hypothetical protein BLNAU_22478 [Blattamonas nauphoetae]